MIRFLAQLVIAAAACTVISGCLGNVIGSHNDAQIRTFNAYVATNSTDGTPMTFTAAGLQIGATRPYAEFTTLTLTLIPTGTFNPSATAPAIVGSLTLPAPGDLQDGSHYDLIGGGKAGDVGVTAPRLFLIPIFDARERLLASGQVAIRLIHLSPGLASVSLFHNAGSGANAFASETNDVPYGFSAPENAYAVVSLSDVGTLSIRAQSDLNHNLLISGGNLSSATFTARSANTIYLIGAPGSNTRPLTAWVVQDSP